jgi:hypothetical protein
MLADFSTKSQYKLSKKAFGGSQVVSCGQTDGQTDRHDEANRCFPQFSETR